MAQKTCFRVICVLFGVRTNLFTFSTKKTWNSVFAQCKISIDNNSDSTEDRAAVKFAYIAGGFRPWGIEWRGRISHVSAGTDIPNFTKIVQSATELLMIRQIFPVHFSETTFYRLIFRVEGTKLNQISDGHRPIIGAPVHALGFRHLLRFEFRRLQRRLRSKIKANFALFHSV